MGITGTKAVLCLLMAGVLTGCQTSRATFAPIGDSSTYGKMFPDPRLVRAVLTERGQVQLNVRGLYNGYKKTLSTIIAETYSGKGRARLSELTPSVFFLTPTLRTHPIGTVYRQRAGVFTADYDVTPANRLRRSVRRIAVKGMVLPGMFLTNSLETLFDASPSSDAELADDLVTDDLNKFTSVGVFALANDVTMDYLPAPVIQPIATHMARKTLIDNKAYYFVADMVIRAKKIAYFVGTNHLKSGALSRIRLDSAEKNSPSAHKQDGVYVATRKWPKARIVAVRYSVMPITDSGKERAKPPLVPIAVEPMLARASRTPGLSGY